jgi:hypothetical protein
MWILLTGVGNITFERLRVFHVDGSLTRVDIKAKNEHV